MTHDQAIEAAEWECFSDPAYYDMWCVRQTGSRTFGEGFHLVNGDEAKMLCRFLNARSFPAAALMEQGARLALEAAALLCNDRGVYEQEAYGLNRAAQNYYRARECIRRLDPAEIVKGSEQ